MDLKARWFAAAQAPILSVLWNQTLPKMEAELWKRQSNDRTDLSITNGVATITWKIVGGGYRFTLNQVTPVGSITTGDKIYTGYLINPSFGGGTWSYGYENPIDANYRIFVTCPANTWTRVSGVMTSVGAGGTNVDRIYLPDLRNYSETDVAVGSTVQVKCPICVNLTRMYGAGREPTATEFERQCRINGIDLTEDQPLDITGTTRTWQL